MEFLKFKLLSEGIASGWLMMIMLVFMEIYNRYSSILLPLLTKQIQTVIFWIRFHCGIVTDFPQFTVSDFKTTLRVSTVTEILYKLQRERNLLQNLKYRNHFEL